MRSDLTADFGALTDDQTVLFERRLPGSLALLWCYLTTRELLATWLGEGRFECRIGGNVRLYSSESSIQGSVTTCKPYSSLGYSWDVLPNSGPSDTLIGWDSYVSYELMKEGDHVLLRLTHTPIPDVSCPRVFALWHTFLDRLCASMRQLRPEPLSRRFERVLPHYQRRLDSHGTIKFPTHSRPIPESLTARFVQLT
jgi:uncharacterized protein YndB with AHSA1/START domain